MDKNLSLVSILIPTYQGEEFLEATFCSALAQTYPNLEIIVSDDGSNDRTVEIAKSFSDKYKGKFQIYTNKKLGMVENWNFCLSVAKGKYIKFLFQDDLLEPNCIEEMVTLAEQDEEIGLVFSPRSTFISDGADSVKSCVDIYEQCIDLHQAWSKLESIQSGQTLLADPNFLKNPLNKIGEPTTVLVKKEVFEHLGGFDASLRQIVDLDMWIRIMVYYKIGFINRVLSSFRIHPNQQSQKNNNSGITLNDHKRFYEKILTDPCYFLLPEKVKLKIYYRIEDELEQAKNRIKQLETQEKKLQEELIKNQGITVYQTLPGINLTGGLNGLKSGEAAKSYITAIKSLNIPIKILDFFPDNFHLDNPHLINLICVNKENISSWVNKVDRKYFANKYNIGVGGWELPELINEHHELFSYFQEIWVGSNYIQETIIQHSILPVVKIPPVVKIKQYYYCSKSDFKINKHEFVFLLIFDCLDLFNRKNPLAVIEAFKKTFSSYEAVRLVIKCINGNKDSENFTMLKNSIKNTEIILIDDDLSEDEKNGLLSVCDCYISLHRLEEVGLNIAEAMLMEKPVIATGWSGNMDFMNISNSYPVRFNLIPLLKPYASYKQSQQWAEPDLIHASQLMRYVYENPLEAKVIGKRAAQDINQINSLEAVNKLIKARLEVIPESKILGLQQKENELQQSYAELEQTKSQLQQSYAELEQTKSQLQQSYAELEQTKSGLDNSQNWITAMESSKFWKLRTKWFKLKYAVGIEKPDDHKKPEINQQVETPNQDSQDVQLFIDSKILIPNVGFYFDGWIFDPKLKIKELTLTTEYESVDLKPFLRKKARKDVADYFQKLNLGDGSEDIGVYGVCYFKETSIQELNLSVKLESGNILNYELNFLKPPSDSIPLIRNILTSCPLPAYQMRSVLDEYVGPTVRGLWQNRALPEVKKVIRNYGNQVEQPEVSIIVPLYGRIDFVKYQLALFADDLDLKTTELIYVLDDPRLSQEFLYLCDSQASIFEVPFKTLCLGVNLGYAGANNAGVSISSGRLVLLLNSDVMPIKTGWLSSMVDFYNSLSQENIGAIGPKLLYFDESIQHAGMKFAQYGLWDNLWINDHPRKGQPNFSESNDLPQKLSAVTGACMMVLRELYDQVGGIDEEYIIGDFEDSDFCLKLHAQGFQNYYLPNVELFHLERQSLSLYQQSDDVWQNNRTLYNCWLYNQKWGKYITENNL